MQHSFTSPALDAVRRALAGRALRPRHMHRRGWGRGMGGGGSGPRARRGDVRSALLLLLDEEPRNGYGLMQEIERRSSGLWRPSPGSVYPALSQLEDEGLVATVEQDGKRAFTLTDEGRAHVEANRERFGAPWSAAGGEHGAGAGALLTSSAAAGDGDPADRPRRHAGPARCGAPRGRRRSPRAVPPARRRRAAAGGEPPREV